MSKLKIYHTTLLFAALFGLFACSSTRDMQVLVTKPALFELPPDISRILLINRSKGNAQTIIEGILTGELPNRDKMLSEQCMSGLLQTLTLNKNLGITRHNDILQADKGSSTGFGNVMSWEDADKFANEYQVDAILMLEFFDSDFSVRDVTEFNNLQNVFVRGTAKASAGFRLYYPKNRVILYEKSFTNSEFYTESSATRLQAIAKLIKGTDALNRLSYNTGRNFARRLTAYNIWEDRLMYKGKKNMDMSRGERFVVANNWQEGVQAWHKAFENAKNESQKGKIAYNLALGYEVLGNLQEAKKWITTAYVEYADKKAADYAHIINQRIENESILEEQNRKKGQ